MAIQIDMSKLVRRKPDLNVSVLSFNWKESDPMANWTTIVNKYFAIDPKKYNYGRQGYMTLEKEGTDWFAFFGYNVLWEDGWDSHYPPFVKVKVGEVGTTIHELKRNAELRYKQIMVPFFLIDIAIESAEQDLKAKYHMDLRLRGDN